MSVCVVHHRHSRRVGVTVMLRLRYMYVTDRVWNTTMRASLGRERLWAVFFSLILIRCVTGDEGACVVHDNGKIYDLNPLKSKYAYTDTHI